MKDLVLTPEQKKAIKAYLKKFREYLKGVRFQKDQEDRLRRLQYFQKVLPERVSELSEADVYDIITNLWASELWSNKQYLAQKIISDNGIEKLRDELKFLLDASKSVENRYEHFLGQIKGLGPASLTEMLCFIQPEDCGIWNKKARQALRMLGLDTYVDPNKYRISAAEYQTFNPSASSYF